MNITEYLISIKSPEIPKIDSSLNKENTLVLVFSNGATEAVNHIIAQLAAQIPQAQFTGCSTSGQIYQQQLVDDAVLVNILHLEQTSIKKSVVTSAAGDSFAAGSNLAQMLNAPDLSYVLLLSKGLNVNGSQLSAGIRSELNDGVIVTGGLAGDDDQFNQTWVLNDDNVCDENAITAIGFYGSSIKVSVGSQGGWQPIGPVRTITNSEENTLHTLDGQPALSIYSKYLGEMAKDLPASGLLFPLAIIDPNKEQAPKVRTILAVNQAQQTIDFAGDMPTGSQVRLMHASFDRLVDGATNAGQQLNCDADAEKFCLMISCVGRRLVLGQRTEEEIEAVVNSLPPQTTHSGFYSYGELTPGGFDNCELHNQTMTLTLLWEQ